MTTRTGMFQTKSAANPSQKSCRATSCRAKKCFRKGLASRLRRLCSWLGGEIRAERIGSMLHVFGPLFQLDGVHGVVIGPLLLPDPRPDLRLHSLRRGRLNRVVSRMLKAADGAFRQHERLNHRIPTAGNALADFHLSKGLVSA